MSVVWGPKISPYRGVKSVRQRYIMQTYLPVKRRQWFIVIVNYLIVFLKSTLTIDIDKFDCVFRNKNMLSSL